MSSDIYGLPENMQEPPKWLLCILCSFTLLFYLPAMAIAVPFAMICFPCVYVCEEPGTDENGIPTRECGFANVLQSCWVIWLVFFFILVVILPIVIISNLLRLGAHILGCGSRYDAWCLSDDRENVELREMQRREALMAALSGEGGGEVEGIDPERAEEMNMAMEAIIREQRQLEAEIAARNASNSQSNSNGVSTGNVVVNFEE